MTRNLRESAFRIALVMAVAALPCAPLRASNPATGTVSGSVHAGELDRRSADPLCVQHLRRRQQLQV